jgi:hypothetical protein
MSQVVKDIFGHSIPEALRAKPSILTLKLSSRMFIERDTAKDYFTLPVYN